MEFVNQIIAYLTPYFGEYARFAPIVIGAILAIIAFVIKRKVIKGMDADIKAGHVKTSDDSSKNEGASSTESSTTEVDGSAEKVEQAHIEVDAAEITADTESNSQPVAVDENASKTVEPTPVEQTPALSWSQRIKAGLSRTRNGLGSGLSNIVLGSKKIDDDLLEELETQLLMADVGMDATTELMGTLTEKLNRKELKDGPGVLTTLKDELNHILRNSEQELNPTNTDGPFVILMVGVNGVGKTTTIGKLAKKYQADGKSVMLAAGDTFRAAAVEQLQVWGERNNVPVVAQHTGADSASVIYDAIESAKARGVDVVIADTAGRLQNKANLMSELEKVVRVMKKLDVNAPHEVMLVLDAGTGQNALSQAKLFTEAVGVSGITLTKLDGTAKGGIIFAIAKQFGLPIRYIGVGEQVDDLRPFKSQEFVDALFDSE